MKIAYSKYVSTHRGEEFSHMVQDLDNGRQVLVRYIDSIPYAIAQRSDNLWYMLAGADMKNNEDIGPFDSAEEAVMMLLLQSSPL